MEAILDDPFHAACNRMLDGYPSSVVDAVVAIQSGKQSFPCGTARRKYLTQTSAQAQSTIAWVIMAAGATASPAAMIQRTVSTRRQVCASPACKKRSPPLTPLRGNRLPTVRRAFQYRSRCWREVLVCTLDTGRLLGGTEICRLFLHGSEPGTIGISVSN